MTIEPFRRLSSRTFVLPARGVDTDQIIPARFLTMTGKDGLAEAAFHDWRFERDGTPRLDHDLNRIDIDNHRILVAGDNFGCGSSREHAPWALLAFGFRAVISTRIADIFTANALKNGLLAIEVDPDNHAWLSSEPGKAVVIDLENETIEADGRVVPFTVEPFARHCLLEGKDAFDLLYDELPAIAAFEEANAI
jgi:3-isopropylmalate/(R)-2-methylmalate dehydratase small subunit